MPTTTFYHTTRLLPSPPLSSNLPTPALPSPLPKVSAFPSHRHAGDLDGRTRGGRWGEVLRVSSEASRNYDCRSRKSIVELKDDDCCSNRHKMLYETSYDQRPKPMADTSKSLMSIHGLIELLVLCGIILFEDTRAALAMPDIASALPSLPFLENLGDISTGFASAFLLIFFSELGDKTFFIAALLAARNSAATVFTGTFGALAAMTVVSVVLGRTFHYVDEILPFRLGETDLPIDDIAAVCLLVYFGVSTLLDASSDDGLKADEEQKEAEIAVSKFSGNGAGIIAAASTVISTFALVFVAEWGDKSFFSTIALAAASSPLGVIFGALAGHGMATLLAVLGGSLLGSFLSEKVIAYVGGILFLVFAVVTLVEIVT
ncbi:hypothetical protein MLD38_010829 [Melastoma candidum]|uniref:Uncharacterized protein n=1 Tax=Melastoma candidum TaxID=119954 RepID=A0ACB9R468_9MYRT|nr:hypothetical protein MLD38_010829 [Melastoma candidum]